MVLPEAQGALHRPGPWATPRPGRFDHGPGGSSPRVATHRRPCGLHWNRRGEVGNCGKGMERKLQSLAAAAAA